MRAQILMTLLLVVVGCVGCVPEVDDDDTLVTAPRVLAIRMTPAEAKPREKVKVEALYADSDGEIQGATLDWALCADRKPLAELGPVNRSCLATKGDGVLALGDGASASGTLPAEACRSFGPEPGMAKQGEPAGRPADPDPSGGFYQPGRAYDPETKRYAIFEGRVRCDLAGVTQAIYADFNRRYHPNQNPKLDALASVRGKDETPIAIDGKGDALQVKKGAELTLRASWAACEKDAEKCGGAEHYVYFERSTRELVARREAMRVSWFATSGEFRDPRTGRSEADAKQAHSDNVWTAPSSSGDVLLWVVLRDDRGGTSWQRYRVTVEP